MGKQVNFYMTAADEQEFVEFVRLSAGAILFMEVQPSETISPVANLPTAETPGWGGICLWNREYSIPPKLTYISQQRHYVVDKFESEVIEFHRSHLDEGRLVRGRIWAEMSGWKRDDPATVFRKSDAFQRWYDRLANWIRRHSTRDARGELSATRCCRLRCYGRETVSSGACEWRGTLSQLHTRATARRLARGLRI
jgi:hypothetical protein